MPRVDFYKLLNDGSQKVIAACRLTKSGKVLCEGDQILVENLEDGGVRNYDDKSGSTLFFKDGLKFLEQLRFNFTSGYLNASEVLR